MSLQTGTTANVMATLYKVWRLAEQARLAPVRTAFRSVVAQRPR